jgi:hypothetical protein
METLDFQIVVDFLNQWIPTVVSVVGSFAVIATITPNKVDDKIAQFILDLVNFLGGNLGRAKNAE